MPNDFQSQRNIATFEISFDISIKDKPIVLPSDQLLSFITSKIAK